MLNLNETKKPSAAGLSVNRTLDGSVTKYIHADGSETAIKLVKSIENVRNPLTGFLEEHRSERNKYSVFISSSVGCYMSCPFCHLTLKGAKYRPLSSESILNNLKEAIQERYAFSPEIKDRYIKLSWMGMGDAVNEPETVRKVSIELLNWVFENGYAKGLDGVDLSTVLPPVNNAWIGEFQRLEEQLKAYPRNPVYEMDNVAFSNGYYSHRNLFRLFYSVHSAIQESRDRVVPRARGLQSAAALLKDYSQDGAYPVILHHILVDGLNDSDAELDALIGFVNEHFAHNELRILRYNLAENGPYAESSRFSEQIQKLAQGVNFLKVQVSPGNEVSAACGQFIVKDFIRARRAA